MYDGQRSAVWINQTCQDHGGIGPLIQDTRVKGQLKVVRHQTCCIRRDGIVTREYSFPTHIIATETYINNAQINGI